MERVTPEALALTIAMQDELVKRADEAQRLRHCKWNARNTKPIWHNVAT